VYPILAKIFGGLSAQYYFRQFVFGFAFAALIFYLSTNKLQSIQTSMTLFLIVGP
jgi:multisubunit Na+/H+ antiporter MnhE subunit